MNKKIIQRRIIEKIEVFLKTDDILLLYGARQVGKTTIMKFIQQKLLYDKTYFFDLENIEYLELLNKNPNIFVEYMKSYHGWKETEKIVVFIDEIQYLDNPTSFLKFIHDNYSSIKLIVSGSSTLEIRGKLHDSLVGRIIKFEILPLSFEEFLIFKNKENLAKNIGKQISLSIINNEIKFFFEEYTKFGGYPKIALENNANIKKEYLKQIFDSYIQKDIKDIGKIKEIEKFNKALKILADQSGSLLNISEFSTTIGITQNTLNERLFLLENTFVIQLIRPFSNNIRGELTKMPKIFFIDNGIRNFINNSYEIEGNSLENSFFSHINNSYKFKKIQFYRTQDKKEIDFILDGEPYEVKTNYKGKSLTPLNYFGEKYNKKGNIITLNKTENTKYTILYPREI
ncbi:MAG: ATP-binding protein [Candidatus Absconditabacterales bacterium]|nr:ATP-binding protein [Candidatus Absconditabacterales bacterium]